MLKIIVFFLAIPFFGLASTNATNKKDSLAYRIYLGANVPYTYYSQDGFFQFGASFLNRRNEIVIMYISGFEALTGSSDMKNGISIGYFKHLKAPYTRLKFGMVAEYGFGKFYYSWGNNQSLHDRLFTKRGFYGAPAISYSLISYRNFCLDLSYKSGVLKPIETRSEKRKGIYFAALGMNFSYTIRNW